MNLNLEKLGKPKEALTEKDLGHFKLLVDLNSQGIGPVIYHRGIRERCFMSILVNEIEPGYTCIDLGSNIGYTTLYMCHGAGATGKVYAIEPDPWNADQLRKNVNHNGYGDRCEVSECAISDVDGKIEFWQSDKSNLSSVMKTKHSTKCIKVDSFSLKSFLEDRQYPNFIKMDIEGHEVKVFEGGLDYFSTHNGGTKFLVEVHPQFYSSENDFAKILKEYFSLGFKCRYVVSTPVARPTKFVDAGYTPLAEVSTDGFVRGLYGPIDHEHLLDFACKENVEGTSKKIVRSFLIERE